MTRAVMILLTLLSSCSSITPEPGPTIPHRPQRTEIPAVPDPCELIPEAVLREMLHGEVHQVARPSGKHPGFEIESCGWTGSGKRFTMLTVTIIRHTGTTAAADKFKVAYPAASGWSAIDVPGCDHAAAKVPPGEEPVTVGLGAVVGNHVIELTYFDSRNTPEAGQRRLRSLASLLAGSLR